MTTNAIRSTRPAPLPLFDPAVGEVPPVDAVELYFEAPLSVGLFHMQSTLGGREDHVAAIDAAIEAAMSDVLACLHDHALLKVGYHARQRRSGATVGEYQPGQLYLTRVSHLLATDRDGVVRNDVARLHGHVYFGATGTARDGQRWPVDLYSSRRAITQMWPRYHQRLERALSTSLGVAWGVRESGPSPARELIDPPLEQFVADYPRVVCRDGYRIGDRWNVQDIAHPPQFDPDAS
ncbi:MAG: relaxase domain-containing protein [Pseudonocardia sp.]|nr:relaxase domain-containing protein [Pseudonocardia sp.]MDN5920156.1 relaxase domain-containing protein [Pseudonocardia sp.]MDN5933009.1 relaxase domain-containing protein [Pseudonocardia sp.]